MDEYRLDRQENPGAWWEASPFVWPDPLVGPWIVTVGWREIDGRMEPVGLTIYEKDRFRAGMPGEPSHILTAKTVRQLPIGQLIDRGRTGNVAAHELVAGLLEDDGRIEEAGVEQDWAQRYDVKLGRRPRKYGDDHYEKVAAIYTEAWLSRTRESRSPTKVVQNTWQVSHATAARWVHECRDRGLLGPTDERRPGGVKPRKRKEAQ